MLILFSPFPARNKSRKKKNHFLPHFPKQFHSGRALLPPFKRQQLLVTGRKKKVEAFMTPVKSSSPLIYGATDSATHCEQCSALPFSLGKQDHSQTTAELIIRRMADSACCLSRRGKQKILLVSFYFQLSSIKSISRKFQ